MGQFGLLRARRFGPSSGPSSWGAQRQPVQERARHPVRVPDERRGVLREHARQPEHRAAHAALFLFSASAGQIADKFDKARIIRLVKLFEIGIMLLGAAGLGLHSVPLLLGRRLPDGYALGGLRAGQVQHPAAAPSPRRAGRRNALVQMGTFAAILLGTILGGALVKLGARRPSRPPCSPWREPAGSRAAGCRPHPRRPGPAPRLAPVRETLRIVGFARENRTVFLSILGISWFWFYGRSSWRSSQVDAPRAGGDEWVATLLLVVFSVGVALGCMLCERLSSRTVELGLLPFGSIGSRSSLSTSSSRRAAWRPPGRRSVRSPSSTALATGACSPTWS